MQVHPSGTAKFGGMQLTLTRISQKSQKQINSPTILPQNDMSPSRQPSNLGSPRKVSKVMFKRKIRFDKYGTPILKNYKAHRVTFNNPINTIEIVANWKRFNQDSSCVQEDECTCPCSLF